ncbi:N-lysine methyltransferase SETD6-like isoform X2 [Pomacea canaliculata]|uniref:N-lysine methyltransferase SETD6-like isoform X2 n=1 Tax=Pomacea canaliculata TaxID=400727 RepID=UPI000D731DA8|nr:N-lysine methyltransferase SETD6-like isoform X2 [Pomacea canaliculata]
MLKQRKVFKMSALKSLTDFLNGVLITICQCLQRFDHVSIRWGSCVKAQYGMVALQNITEGEVLFSVPRSLLLSPQTSSIAHLLQQGQQELESRSGWVALLVALLYEYNNPSSLWRPYLDLVPDFSQLDLPMFWSREEHSNLLKGTGITEAVDRDLQFMEKEFNHIALPFMCKHHNVFGSSCQSFDLYKKMVAFVMAYSFTEPISKNSRVDQNHSRTEEKSHLEDVDPEDLENTPPMMVPMADILNHVARNNARLTFDTDALRMISVCDIKEGEEVFNTYGELANWHLLHMYGFAECFPNNHYDTVDIPMTVVQKVAEENGDAPQLTAAKLVYLQEHDLLSTEGACVLGMEGVLTDDDMLAIVKVLAMSEEEFAEHAEKEGWSDADSSTSEDSSLTYDKISQLPDKWKQIMKRCAIHCLSQLGGDDLDVVSMATQPSNLTSRQRYSLYVRYGQKQLLNKLIEACS